MKEVSNTTLAILLVIGIIVAFGGAFLNLNRLEQLTGISGLVTKSTVNVTVASYKAIAVTGEIDFGSGYVSSGVAAWMDSGDTSTANGTWSWSAAYYTIENQGNTNLAVWANASQNASYWIAGTSLDTDAKAYINGTEPGSDNGCSGNTIGDMSSGQYALNDTGNAQICSDLDEADAADTVWAHVRISVPSDVTGGGAEKWTNVTFLAS